MAKSKHPSIVVSRYPWTTIKQREIGPLVRYEVWLWNVWKMKWVRSGGYFSTCPHDSAKKWSNEVQDMLDKNHHPPEPL